MKQKDELAVLQALRDCARQVVAMAKTPGMVDAASAEWKRIERRIATIEDQMANAVEEEDLPSAVNFSRQPAPEAKP